MNFKLLILIIILFIPSIQAQNIIEGILIDSVNLKLIKGYLYFNTINLIDSTYNWDTVYTNSYGRFQYKYPFTHKLITIKGRTKKYIQRNEPSYNLSVLNDSIFYLKIYLKPVKFIDSVYINFHRSTSLMINENIVKFDSLSSILHKNLDYKIILEGHTDYLGDYLSNLKLSEQRIKAVRDSLVHKGIKPSKIEKVPYGESKPLIVTENIKNRYSNMRVKIIIIYNSKLE